MSGATDLADWIGRSEERRDVITAGPLERLSATLDRDDPPLADGDAVPPLGHWLFFLPAAPQSALAADGHPERGGFLPPIPHLPRRMWAGSRLAFPGELRVGDRVIRRSTIADIREKSGRTGPLAFVSIRHETGRAGEPAAVIEEQDIVFRGREAAAAPPGAPPQAEGPWRRALVPDAMLLFRYSALTFNAHRIHYDRDYATGVEGYPGLVVHGPLTATLLLDLLRRHAPEARVASFAFRARAPLFAGAAMSVNAGPPDAEGRAALWAADAAGAPAVTAEATLAGYAR